jgi:sodium-dependent dicarboxylate transporter 2/3/5
MSVKRTRLKSDLPKQATYRVGKGRAAQPGPDGGAAVAVAPLDDLQGGPSTETARRLAERTSTTKRRLQRRATPLEILQQPLLLARRKVFDLRRFLIVLGLTALVLVLPAPPGLSEEGHRAMALFVFTGSILALEPAPLPISALLVPVAQVVLGIDDVTGAFLPFGHPSVFLILTSLFLAEALRKHGLTRRLALSAIVVSGGRFPTLLFSLMVLTGLLSMWVQNTATTAVLLPVAITIAQRVPGSDEARRSLPLLLLAVAVGASVGGLATIVGSGENAIASGALNQVTPFGFVDWMKYGLPVAMLLMPLSWWLIVRSHNTPDARIDTAPVQGEIERMGPLSGSEREIILVMLVSVTLWIFGDGLARLLGLPSTALSSVIVSIGAVAYLSFSEIVDWNDMKGVNWGVFLVIGAGFTLGDALQKSGFNDWVAELAEPLLSGLPFAVTLLVLVGIGFVITQFINDVTLGAIFSPILIALAQASGIPPERLVVPTILAVGLAYALPSASARMALVAVTGAVDRKDMFRTGMIVGIPSMVVVYLFFMLLTALGWI